MTRRCPRGSGRAAPAQRRGKCNLTADRRQARPPPERSRQAGGLPGIPGVAGIDVTGLSEPCPHAEAGGRTIGERASGIDTRRNASTPRRQRAAVRRPGTGGAGVGGGGGGGGRGGGSASVHGRRTRHTRTPSKRRTTENTVIVQTLAPAATALRERAAKPGAVEAERRAPHARAFRRPARRPCSSRAELHQAQREPSERRLPRADAVTSEP